MSISKVSAPPTGALPMAVRERVGRRTSVAALDAFIGDFEPSTVTLIDSSHRIVDDIAHMVCLDEVTNGGSAVWVDGGNTIDPYRLSAMCRRHRTDARGALDAVSVSRAFTAYQLSTLIDERCEARIRDVGAGTLIVTSFLDLYLDKDMWWSESRQLMRRANATIRRLTEEYGLVTMVTNRGLGKMSFRKGLKHTMYSSADRVLRIDGGKRSVRMTMVDEDRSMRYHPVEWPQTTIEEFL